MRVMTVRPIVITGEPVLHRRAAVVETIDDQIRLLVADMFETMDAANGVGLAAPQIGVGLRIFTWGMANDDGVPARGVLVNPYVTSSKPASGRPDPDEESEGCLSVPGEQFPTGRADWARVTGVDRTGAEVELEGTGFFARMLQHETGHLDGLLYVDVLVGRNARAAKKTIKKNGWGIPGLTWMPGEVADPFGHDDHDDAD